MTQQKVKPSDRVISKSNIISHDWRRRRRRWRKDVLKTAGREEVLLGKLLQSIGDFTKQNEASAKCFGHIVSQ